VYLRRLASEGARLDPLLEECLKVAEVHQWPWGLAPWGGEEFMVWMDWGVMKLIFICGKACLYGQNTARRS
jgi:hypothetical protein